MPEREVRMATQESFKNMVNGGSTMVEHLLLHPRVNGLSIAAAAGTCGLYYKHIVIVP